jgi:hypothetical protein
MAKQIELKPVVKLVIGVDVDIYAVIDQCVIDEETIE